MNYPTPTPKPLRRKPKPKESADVLLVRSESSPHGTFGQMIIRGMPGPCTLEPPWKDNRSNVSCIPTGQYRCVWHRSPRFGWVYLVTDVPGRGHVLIHPGNFGGSVEDGLKTHTHGCILLGSRRGVIGNQKAVLVSRTATRAFFEKMGHNPFLLSMIKGY